MSTQGSPQGLCRLCKCWCTLQKSHAVPDSLFRRLFKKGNGSAIGLTNDTESPIQRTQDSWTDYLLCTGCETRLNTQYDVCGDRFSKGTGLTIEPFSAFVRISNLDVQRLRMYFLSVLWRMAESSAAMYQVVRLTSKLSECLAQCFLNNTPINESAISVRLNYLVDSSGAGGLPQDEIDHLIVSPWGVAEEQMAAVTFKFVHAGYLVSMRFPGMSVSGRRQQGVLTGRANTVIIPQLDLLAIPELENLLVVNKGKQLHGKVSKGVQKLVKQHRMNASSSAPGN